MSTVVFTQARARHSPDRLEVHADDPTGDLGSSPTNTPCVGYPTAGGKVQLHAVKDCYSNKIVGYRRRHVITG